MTQQELEKKMQELSEEVGQLKRRAFQEQITPDIIKMRHIGEGVRYIRDGKTADKATSGEEPAQGAAIFFDYNTNTLYIWNRLTKAWKSEVLT